MTYAKSRWPSASDVLDLAYIQRWRSGRSAGGWYAMRSWCHQTPPTIALMMSSATDQYDRDQRSGSHALHEQPNGRGSSEYSGEVQFTRMRLPIDTFRLPNGLFVTLSEDHTAPIVAVNLWYHVGSANERAGRTGFAHLFEHMLFQGSANVAANEHFELVQRAGGTLNGSTWLDRTNYFETVPSNQLELALWLEANRMGQLLPAMTQQKLDTQRDVVKNERRWSVDNQPYGTWWEKLPALALPAGASVPSFADRLDGGSDGGEPRRRRAVLRDVLHAGQRRALDRRRLRSRRSASAGRANTSAPIPRGRGRAAAAADMYAAADVRRVAARSGARTR